MPATELYGVAVASAAGPRLVATIERKGNNVHFLPTMSPGYGTLDDGTSPHPHVSYHASGQHHVKSYGQMALTPIHRQHPDEQLKGIEPLFDLTVRSGEWSNSPLANETSGLAELFVLSSESLHGYLYVTLSAWITEPGIALPTLDYLGIPIALHCFKSRSPWVQVIVAGRRSDA